MAAPHVWQCCPPSLLRLVQRLAFVCDTTYFGYASYATHFDTDHPSSGPTHTCRPSLANMLFDQWEPGYDDVALQRFGS